MKTLQKPKVKKIMWILTMIISLLGVALMFTVVAVTDAAETRHFNKEGKWVGEAWWEWVILPFYFTFLSNLMAFIFAFCKVFDLIKNLKIEKRFQIFTTTNLSLTLLTYWTLLFPNKQPSTVVHWVDTITVHLLVPLVLVFMYFVEFYKVHDHRVFPLWKTSLIHLILPSIWLLLAIMIYYILGGTSGAAVYHFLNFNENKWYMSLIYLLGIAIGYFLLTLFFVWIGNIKRKQVSKAKPVEVMQKKG